MAFDEKVRAFVRRYYVFDRLTLEQSAEKAGVAFGTARRWKSQAQAKGDDWDKARDVQVMVGGDMESLAAGMLSGFIIQYKSVMSELETEDLATMKKVELLTGLADSFAKMTASSKKLLPETSAIATAMQVIEMMADLVKTKKTHLLPDFMDLFDDLERQIKKEFKNEAKRL
ncbi:DUF1804 family protein [Caviibacterium pharyngocola]|uniref:DNA-binding protein n=1 Tax=Caviibacterium pharyngocola TaxID=28159 RepID=A0A2M8RY16_9PAST|nr:DUF1804 family protein [Caviibacterium pharyngocola]PJG83779.1 DNA-binding protein [Caviibacterium pharyngocola]